MARAFLGDLKVVRAVHRIEEGEELYTSYKDMTDKFHEDQTTLLDNYGFVCDCDLCKTEDQISHQDMAIRHEILEKLDTCKPIVSLKGTYDSAMVLLDQLQALVESLERNFDDRLFHNIRYRHGLARLQTTMIVPYMRIDKSDLAVQSALKAVKALGFCFWKEPDGGMAFGGTAMGSPNPRVVALLRVCAKLYSEFGGELSRLAEDFEAYAMELHVTHNIGSEGSGKLAPGFFVREPGEIL